MKKKYRINILSILIPIAVVLFNFLIILFPKETIGAAKDGLSLWFNNVFPALLPFIIGSNILMGLGVVSFFGVLLEPVMSPLFGVPGSGGYAFAVGLMSGYPMGSKIVCELRQKNEITKTEAQRLLSFVNNSGPLFVIGAVASGMFENVTAGYFILIIHYLGAVCTGLLFKHYKVRADKTVKAHRPRLLRTAYKKMLDARKEDNRPLGLLLGQSVANAMETILQIGGFIILFCVISKALELVGFFDLLIGLLKPFGAQEQLYKGIFVGIIEITNGASLLSRLGGGMGVFIATAAVISWGGLSIHAQSASFLAKTDVSIPLYLFSKFINSMLTVAFGFILYPFFRVPLTHSVGVFSQTKSGVASKLLHSTAYFGMTLAVLLIIVLLTSIHKSRKRNRL